MVKLWSKNGKLISSDDKSKLIECSQCPCDSIAIELDCPSSLHTLGEGKPFTITATYAAPSASSVLPHIEITYDCVDPDTAVFIVLESGGVLDFTTGWTGVLGTDEVLTFDAGNIMAVGHILEDDGVTRTCNATITAWDPNRVDTNGDPIEPVTCIIALWDDVNCSITAPSSECDGNEFSASITTSGTGAAGKLVRMDSDDGIFSDPQTRFDLYLNGISLNSGGTSKWTRGEWNGTHLSNSSSDPMEISFEEYGVELCSEEITVKKCGISSITVTCPGCLHTLGAGGTLAITVVYDDIAGWSGKPDVSVTPSRNAIIDADTLSPPDFSSHWETDGDTKTWTRSIRPSADYLSGTSRSASVTFSVGSDKYVDGNGDRLADVTCTTYISDVVTCDGVTLMPMSDNPCTGGHLNIQITLKGDCGGEEGAELTYINHPPSGLFGTWPPFRFEFDIAGDYEMVEDHGWVNGVYDSLIKMTGVKDELGVIEDIEVTVSEYGEELCRGTFTPVPCEVEATIDCPESLHTLGPSKWLTITLTYTDPDEYAPLLDIELYQGATSYTAAAIGLIMEDDIGGTEVATFGPEEWWLEGNVRTWRHKVQINSMPAEWEDGDAICIRVIMDYEDNSGNEVTGDECSIALHYKVECDGEAILPSSGCVNETQDATITVKGTNGDDLVRMDYNENPGLFGGNLQFYRFKVAISGGGTQPLTPEGYSIHENWVQGVWSCLEALGGGITPNSYIGDPVHITFEDAANTPNLVCEAEMTVEECGCTVEIDCPGNLHVYGDAKTLTIIITYTDPDLNDTHPNFYIEMAAVGDPIETLRDADGPISLADGPDWTWVGNSKIWQKDIHINGVAHTSGTTTVTIRATHINSLGIEEDLDTCPITISERISCSISGLPSDSCVDADDGKKTVGFSISVTGDPSETLTNWNPSPGGRFTITTSLPLPEGVSLYSGWTNGSWSVSGIEAGPGEHYVTLYDDSYPDDGCHDEFALDIPPTPSVTFGCPESLHTLGAAKLLTLTYTINHPDYIPYFEVSSPLLLDDGTEAAVNLDINWTSLGNFTYQWQRNVRVDEVPGGGHTGTITISAYYDPVSGDPVPIGTPCSISITDEVTCSITAPTEVCVEEEFDVSISITDINGDTLPRLDSTAFNDRFSLDIASAITVPAGCAPGSGWSQGQWSCSGLYIGEASSASIMIKDNGSITCQSIINARISKTPFAIEEYPTDLHIYGEAGTLKLVLWGEDSCEPPDMSEWVITHSLLVDGVGYPLNDCLSLANGDPISFSSGWVDGVWEHDIRLNSAPFAQGADSCSMDLEIVATHAISGGETLWESAYIMGMRDLIADIVFSPTYCYPYAGFEVTITITSSVGDLPRLPSNGGVTISRGPEDEDSTATLHRSSGTISFSFTDGVCTLDNLYVDEACTYYIKAEQDLSGEDKEVGYGSIKIALESADLDDLIEAINERRAFQNTSLLSTNTTNLNTVRTWVNYVNRDWAVSHNSNGDLQYDADFSTLPPTAPAAGAPQSEWDAYYDDVDGWISDAYAFVCRKVEIGGGGRVEKAAKCGKGSYCDPGIPGSKCCPWKVGNKVYYKICATTTHAGAFRIAKREALAMDSNECSGPSGDTYIMQGYSFGDKAYYLYGSTPCGSCRLTRRYARLKSSTSIQAVARYRRTVYGWVARPSLYDGSGDSNTPFNSLGESKMPPAGGKILYWTYSGSGTLFYSPWSLKTPPPILEPPSPPLCYNQGGTYEWKIGGYVLTMSTVLQKVSFKH